jgi:23S rRNA pseudouridine1911/1915/1917 synthase
MTSPRDDTPDWEDRYEVLPNYDGWRLDRFLTQMLRRATRAQTNRIIRGGVVFSDGRRAKPASRVRAGDVVVIGRLERGDPDAPALDAVGVLASAADWVVLDKPAGMLVHRTAHEATRTVEVWLRERFPGERVEPVHRLDRDTSGVLVCARGADAIRALREAFGTASVEKEYAAAVRDARGLWRPGQTRVFDTPLGFEAGSTVKIRIGVGGWPCRTTVTCVGRAGELAQLQCHIDQGRQHQIRAHLALFGTPVLGDKLYEAGNDFFLAWIDAPGAPELVRALPVRWHCLHARKVAFSAGGERIVAQAPLPARMAITEG